MAQTSAQKQATYRARRVATGRRLRLDTFLDRSAMEALRRLARYHRSNVTTIIQKLAYDGELGLVLGMSAGEERAYYRDLD